MAIVTGEGGNPKETNNNATKSGVANVLSTAEYLQKMLTELEGTRDNVATIAEVISTQNTAIATDSPNGESPISANTSAILGLTDTIKSASVSIDAKNFDSNFFTSLLSLMSNETRLNKLYSFATMFERSASIMGGAQRHVKGIEAVSSAMMAAASPIASMAKSSLMFSGGLAILGLTLMTFIEAITFEDLFKFGLIIGTIAGISRLTKGAGWDTAKLSIGIATLGLTVWGFNELVTPMVAGQFALSTFLVMGGIVAAGKLANTIGGGKTFANIIKSTVAIAAISGSVYIFGKAMGVAKTIDLGKAAELGLVIAGYGLGFKMLGSMTGSIVKGAVASAAIGGGLWVLSKGLEDLSRIDMSLSRALELAAITTGAAAILTLIGNPLTIGFTLAGAAASAAIGGGLMMLGGGLSSLAKVNISPEQSANFKYAVGTIADTFVSFANPLKLPLMLLGLAQSALLAGSTLAMSGAVSLVSNMKVAGQDKFDAFKNGSITLADIFSNFGGPIRLAKVTMGAGIATLVAGATVATALGIATMTRVISSPSKVTAATESLGLFIGGVETALVGREKSFPAIQKGIHSFMGISDMVREVADSAQAIGNLEFIEKEVRNGKVVIKSVRKFTPQDFQQIGTSVGMILSALTDPLIAIGGSKDSFSIGGFTVTNPFSNKVQAGISAVSEIGNVFTPLANILDVFAKNNIDEAYVTAFNKNLGILLGGMTTNFAGLQAMDDGGLERLGLGTKYLNDLVFNLSAERMDQGAKNFESMGRSAEVIKNSVNAIDLDKLSKLNELVFNIKAAVETDALEELVSTFGQFINELADKLGNIATNTKTSSEPKDASESTSKSTDGSTIKSSKTEAKEDEQPQIDLSEVTDKLEDLANILRTSTLKVRTTDDF